MKNKIITLLGALMILAPMGMAQAISSEMQVTKDGKATLTSAKVMQIAGSTIFARLYWGDAYVRITFKTNSTTKFYRATGEATTLAEVHEGDLLDTTGVLETGSNTLSLVTSSIRNSSVQKEQGTLSGTVTGVDLSLRQFTLNTKDRGLVTIRVAASTQFTKGNRTLDLEHIRVGDRITKASGDYDYTTKTLAAQAVTTYIDMSMFKAQNFVGKLAEAPIIGATSIKVTVGKITYTVFLTDKTSILRANKSATTLQRFVVGDSIRFYGIMREVDEPIIDAEIIRNTSL